MDEIELIEGDTLPWVTGEVTDDAGAPVDITGWDITLHIGYVPPLVKVATIPLGTDGIYQFAWEPGELIPGRWPAEVQLSSGIGVQTFQRTRSGDALMLRVLPQIA